MSRRFIQGLKKLTDKPDAYWKGRLFLVIAERWSSPENHSYPIGVYKTLSSAVNNANKEMCFRGGKYGCVIYATRHPNNSNSDSLIKIYEIESPYKGRVGKKEPL